LVDKIISKAHLILFLILFFSFIRTAFDLVNDQSLFNYISIFLSFVAVISMSIVLVIIHKEKNSKEEITK
jgi:hypothetical protein